LPLPGGVFGPDVVAKLRGTVQADILKEVQAQNEIIFPLDASLRFLGDMVEFTIGHMPRWYPISISGYHIAEAGATPCSKLLIRCRTASPTPTFFAPAVWM